MNLGVRQPAGEAHVQPLWTVADIAQYLALSEDHVRERIVTRVDFPRPALALGRTRRWRQSDIERWMVTASSARRKNRAG
jgi:predicted DNA-binding transcriptional regulator AlpA